MDARSPALAVPSLSWPLRYAIAIALPFGATALQLLFMPAVHHTPFVTFFLAVFVSAWVGGGGPGAIAVLLSTILGAYCFMPPPFSFDLSGAGVTSTLLFTAVGSLIAALAAMVRRGGLERSRLLEATRAAQATAEEASRAKDQVLAMLGHELRNPLAPMKSALELMRRRGDAATVRERQILERQVRHLERLVDDLLDVARSRSRPRRWGSPAWSRSRRRARRRALAR